MAWASLAAALVGVLIWPFVGGWAALILGSIAIAVGTVALVRINRAGGRGQWAAIAGITLGALPFAAVGAAVAWDMIDPVMGYR